MVSHARDAALAAVSGAFLLGVLAATGALDALGDPRAVAVGVGAGLAVEWAFVSGTPVADWWDRPVVAPASAVALGVGGAVAAWWLGPVLVAAACWGLAVYFAALALALGGVPPGEDGGAGN